MKLKVSTRITLITDNYGGYITIKQSRFQSKEYYQEQSKLCHNDKGVNLSGRDNHLQLYATKNRSSKYVKQKLIELQREMDKSTIILRNFKSFSIIDKIGR